LTDVTIRPTRVDEGEALRAIERRAGQRFHDVGLHDVATAEPTSVAALTHFAAAGRSWVVVDVHDEPLGYVIVDIVDGHTHIAQISVLPEFQGTHLGGALHEHVCGWTRQHGRHAITLTTFAAVPWNQPLYEHLGFVVLRDDQIGPELRHVQALEVLQGLDPAARVCMRMDLES
jgi:GNAT superfamily N-acetyltransferase